MALSSENQHKDWASNHRRKQKQETSPTQTSDNAFQKETNKLLENRQKNHHQIAQAKLLEKVSPNPFLRLAAKIHPNDP
ncbi:MAG: hypothetical protein NW226_10825, partial [Microscillaceae bacterium]|nr:hypothetical protein [Microscillaceae bacterium]